MASASIKSVCFDKQRPFLATALAIVLMLSPPSVAEVVLTLDREFTLPDSITQAGEKEFIDVTGSGTKELVLRNRNPFAIYSIEHDDLIRYFHYTATNAPIRYCAAFLGPSASFDVVSASLAGTSEAPEFYLSIFRGFDNFETCDTVWHVGDLVSGEDYSISELFAFDADLDGFEEVYCAFYYADTVWDNPAHPPDIYIHETRLKLGRGDEVTPQDSLPTRLEYVFVGEPGGDILLITLDKWVYTNPPWGQFGGFVDAGFDVSVTPGYGEMFTHRFHESLECEDPPPFDISNDYNFLTTLTDYCYADIINAHDGLELLVSFRNSMSVYSYYGTCSATEHVLAIYDVLEPDSVLSLLRISTISEQLPERVFADSRFANGFFGVCGNRIYLYDAVTGVAIDSTLQPLEYSFLDYTTIADGRPPKVITQTGWEYRTYELDTASTTSTGDAQGESMMPRGFVLLQPYPNPFNPTVSVPVTLREKAHLKLKVYNAIGQCVDVIYDRLTSPGDLTVSWDGSAFASGVYLFKATAGDESQTVKAVLVK